MRPYLAIIKDSFREALASRVLWILLVLITALLLVIVPFGWREHLTSRIQPQDIRFIDQFTRQLRTAGALDEVPTPRTHVWSLLSPELQAGLAAVENSDDDNPRRPSRLRRKLAGELNEVIRRDDFFDRQLWREIKLTEEADDLLSRDELTEEQQHRFNYLALQAAFPAQIHSDSDTSVMLTYLMWDLFEPIPVGADQVEQVIQLITSIFINFFLGFVGVFTAILVTAPIIPNMFDAGSFHLLLSKPISRPLLFVAKFFGGCSFVLINSAYLILGVWLLLGARYEIWNHRLLWCIPIFLFLFTIYYSVSAMAGLIWRNSVVAIVFTILFWVMCFTVGTAKQSITLFLINPSRLTHLTLSDGDVLAVSQKGTLQHWNSKLGNWNEIRRLKGAPPNPMLAQGLRLLGPIQDRSHDRLVMIENRWRQCKLLIATSRGDWQVSEVSGAPAESRELLHGQNDRILVLAEDGLYRLDEDSKPELGNVEVFGVNVPIPKAADPFQEIELPSRLQFSDEASVAVHRMTGEIFHCDGKMLTKVQPDSDQKYTITKSIDLGAQLDRRLAVGGPIVLVATEDGDIQIRNSETLEMEDTIQIAASGAPHLAFAAPNGRWLAVYYRPGKLWIYDIKERAAVNARILRQEDISAVAFGRTDELLICDRGDRVTTFNLVTREQGTVYDPPMTTLQLVYHYVLLPIYTVFPKPSELENTINYMIMEGETVPFGPNQEQMDTTQIDLDPWRPVWSSLAFTIVMVFLACFYISRQEY